MRKTHLTAGLAALAASAAFAGSALAAGPNQTVVTGAVANTLAVTAQPTAVITGIGPGATGTGSSSVTVTASDAATPHTITISDGTTGVAGHSAGVMDRVLGTGPAKLTHPLQWSNAAAGTYADLLTTAANVSSVTGLVSTQNVFFKQLVDPTEALVLGDTYGITITYTAS